MRIGTNIVIYAGNAVTRDIRDDVVAQYLPDHAENPGLSSELTKCLKFIDKCKGLQIQ